MATSQVSSELPAGFVADPAELPEGFAVDAPKKKVGVFESMLRTAAQAAAPVVRTIDLAAAGLAGIAGDKAGQEKIFQESEQRQQRMSEEYAPAEGEEFSPTGEVLGGAASMPIAVLGQGVAPGINRAAEVAKRGGTGGEIAQAGAVSGVVNQALLMLPAFLGGKVAEKIGGGAVRQAVGGAATGAAVNVPASIAGKAAENAALPEGDQFKDLTQEPLDTKDILVQAGLSAALGAAGAGGARIKANKAAKAATPAFPADKFEDLGDGNYRAPNGATMGGKEAWESSSKKVRDGWLEEAPKEEKPTEPKLREEADRLREEHPTGPVADVLKEVEAKRTKAAKVKGDAEELRRAAEQTTDVELKKALNTRADKLDPREKIPAGEAIEGEPKEKIPVGETKEGQPEIKTEQPKKLPVGEATEVPEPYKGEKIPTGEAKEVTRSGAEPAVPVGESKELYILPEKRNAAQEVVKPEGVQSERGQGNEGGQAAEAGAGDRVLDAAESKGQESADLTFPKIEEGMIDTAAREKARTETRTESEPSIQGVAKPPARGIEHARRALTEGMKDGTVDKDGGALALWALDKNPSLARGLRIERGEANPADRRLGSYAHVEKVVKLFQAQNSRTAAHEILHHSERMMPDIVQTGIRREWKREVNRQIRKTKDVEERRALRDIIASSRGDTDARARVMQQFKDKKLDAEKFYHLTNPSEFWAVNAARILQERHVSRGAWRDQAKRWLHEMVEHVKGIVGVRSDSTVLKALDEVMNPKKTTGFKRDARMLAEGGPRAEVPRDFAHHTQFEKNVPEKVEKFKEAYRGLREVYAKHGKLNDFEMKNHEHIVEEWEAYKKYPPQKGSISYDFAQLTGGKRELPEEKRADVAERKLFDRFNRVAKLQEVQPPKSEKADIYQADQLYQGRAQQRGDVLERDYIKPLGKTLEAAKKAGLTVRDADDYLMALHAPERNREIAKINPKLPDGGSGMMNKQAADIIKSFTPEQREHLDEVAKLVHGLNRAKLDAMVTDGLITPALRDALNAKYKKYVPLKTLDAEDEFLGVGQGYSMRANDIKEALGRQSKASSPIASSLLDASRSIIRGEKARVDRTIWEYAKEKEAHDFIKPYDPKSPPPEVMGRKKDASGQVKPVVDPQKVKDLTVDLVIDGEQQKVFVPDQLLRDQIKKLATTNDPGPVLSAIAKGTGAVGRMLTEFNPAFTLPNAARDAITIGVRAKAHGVEPGTVLTGIPKAWATISKYKLDPNSPDAKLYKEFLDHGGKTGAYGIQDMADTMRRLERAGAELGYDELKGGPGRKLKNALKDAAHVISSGNEIMEYAGRFSVYKELRAKGESPSKAAAAAKEITVNFNRSGEWGRSLNSVLVFANAALQGLRNTIVYAKNPSVQKGMMGLVALGAAAQGYNEMVGGMDEETGEPNINTQNDAMGDKNLMGLLPGSSKGFKIPLPPEYSWLFALGRRAYRAVSQGHVAKEAAGIAGNLIDAVLPVRLPEADSGALAAAKAVTPTLASPFVDIWTNQNYFGQPIVPDTHGDKSPPPSFTTARSTTSDVAKGVSEMLNTVSGGDKITPGLSQKALGPLVSPEGIEHLVGFFTGGLGQLAMQSKNLAKGATEGKPVDVNKIPIANRFVFDEPKSYTSRRYKELTPEFEYARDYQKAGTPDKIDPKIQRALGDFEGTERELRTLFKQLRSASTDTEKESLQADIKRAQSRVVRAYNGQPAP